jgi:hypothetical protein
MKVQKYYIVLILFLQLGSINAQKTLNGFLNIPFGIDIETAKEMLLQRKGVKFIREIKSEYFAVDKSKYTMRVLIFTGVSIGKYKADTCIILSDLFIKNKFSGGALIFNNHSEEFYSEIFDILKEKYGEPDKTSSSNYNETNYWYFLPSVGKFYKNQISLDWRYNRSISLSYGGDGTMNSMFKNPIIEKREKELNEF